MPELSLEHDLVDLAVALGLGLLIGLERERVQSQMAGLRTFALIALAGALCGLLEPALGNAAIFGGFIALGLVMLGANLRERTRLEHEPDLRKLDPGMTTEVAVVLVFALGAHAMVGDDRVLTITSGVVTALLLHLKPQLHGMAEKVGSRDMKAVLQFVVAAFVIYPILPEDPVDPMGAISLREVWLMVVLVSGLSLLGYFLFRTVGQRAGALLSGAVGGLISSTATTVTLSRHAKHVASMSRLLAVAIALASAVVYVRVVVEMGIIAPGLVAHAWVPFALLFVVSLALCGVGYWLVRRGDAEDDEAAQEKLNEAIGKRNPAQLRVALIFAVLYAAIKLAVSYASERLSQSWLYAIAMVSGLTDVDAIALSMSKMVADGGLEADMAWRLVLIAVLANLVFKAGIAVVLGGLRMLRELAWLFGVQLALGVVLLLVL